MTKYCPGCKQDLVVDCFGRHKGTEDGLQPYCLDCRKVYYQKHKDKILAKQKEYQNRPEVKVKRRITDKKYQEEHPEVHRKANKKYYENHKDKISEYHKERYKNNREKIKQQNSQYRVNNKQKRNVTIRKWKARNKDKIRVYEAIRRTRKSENGGEFNFENILEIYEQQNGLCYYCKNQLNNVFHIDHKIPVSRGGTSWPDNLCCTCSNCNLTKNNKTEQEFMNHVNSRRI